LPPDVFSGVKMVQMRWRPGLRHRPRWGSSQRSPDLLVGLRGGRRSRKEGRGRGKRKKKGGKKVAECII